MALFHRTRSFGPRISLTEMQVARVTRIVEDAGLAVSIDQCHTGSVYITICEPDEDGCCGEEIAKIRLSGHDEGRRQDSTHVVVGPKSMCWSSAVAWVSQIIAEQAAAGATRQIA